MKRAALAFGGRSSLMIVPSEVERLTGYHPGGRRGMMIELAAQDLTSGERRLTVLGSDQPLRAGGV